MKGIAIVVPDKALGPVVAKKAKDAGIPLIAVDDDITYKDGSPVPYVGIDALTTSASRWARRSRGSVKAEGWDKDWSNVRVGSVEDQKADTCMRRNQGAEEAFLAAFPDFPKENIVRIPYDNTMVNAIDVVATTLTANPAVERWIFFSCNDDGVLGSVRATENAGDGARPGVIGIGIDGSPLLRGVRRRQAHRLPRHDVARTPPTHGARRDRRPSTTTSRAASRLPMVTYMPAILIGADNFADYKAKLGCK